MDANHGNQIALELHALAKKLNEHEIDNGPMGSYRPFKDDAARLHLIAHEIHKCCSQNFTHSSSDLAEDFRDAPWEPR